MYTLTFSFIAFPPPPSENKYGTIKDHNLHWEKISHFIFKGLQLVYPQVSIKRKNTYDINVAVIIIASIYWVLTLWLDRLCKSLLDPDNSL